MSLKNEALDFLKNRPISLTLQKISDDTGIPVGWLKAFGQDVIKDPGVSKVEALLELKKSMGQDEGKFTRNTGRA